MRLQTFISHHSEYSRRKAFQIVQEGMVTVNGKPVDEPSFDVDPAKDRVSVAGRLIRAVSYEYILMNKPAGFVSTRSDRFAEKIIYDLLPENFRKLTTVGRLDKDTEGLLLLTNDGELANRLTHPRFGFDKTYFVRLKGPVTKESLRTIQMGVMLDDGKTSPASIKNVVAKPPFTELSITIHEGRKRQIRRMFDTVACHVVYLKRLSMGPLFLDTLKPGKWRSLTVQELRALKG